MKLHCEANLDYQLQAIEAVCDLFRGQEVCRTEVTVTQVQVEAFAQNDLGIGNRLQLLGDEMLMSSDRDFTLWPNAGTELTIDLAGTFIGLPVVGGAEEMKRTVRQYESGQVFVGRDGHMERMVAARITSLQLFGDEAHAARVSPWEPA